MPPALRIVVELSRLHDTFTPGASLGYRRNLGDGVSMDATFSWDEALFSDLLALRRAPPPAEAMRRVGARLRDWLLALGWLRDEDRAHQALREGARVRVELVSSAPELYALPWELCAFGASGLGIGEVDGIDAVLRWPLVRSPRPKPTERRLLFAWAGEVPAEAQRAALEAHWRGPKEERPQISLSALREALATAAALRRPFTHLHLLAHGERVGEGGALALADGPADAGALQALLAPYADSLELVVLSSCVSGAQEAQSALGSPGLAAHRGGAGGGLRAVLASRFPLSARGSVVLTGALYEALLGSSPEAAVSAARGALRQAGLGADALGLQLLLAPVEDAPARNTVHNLPFGRNSDFVGRDGELQTLATLLAEPGAPVSIHGGPGTGKTQLALEYCHQHLRDYEAVLWVDAHGEDITLAFAGLAEDPLRLGLPSEKPAAERAALVRKVLEDPQPRLLIFENVERPEAVWPHLPRSGETRALLTTRRSDVEGVRPLALDLLPREAAMKLLIGDRALDDAERAAADAACAELGDLALAVAVAARVMRQRRPSELLTRLRADTAALLERAGVDARFGRAPGLPALYDQSFELLDPAVPEDQAARVQLEIAAFYAPLSIPPALLHAAASQLVKELDDWTADDGLQRLCDIGLAQRDQQGGLVVHRLTRIWAARRGGDPAREAALQGLIQRCRATAPEPRSIRELAPLRAHLERVSADLAGSEHPDRFIVPIRLAQLLHILGDAAGSRRVCEAALTLQPPPHWEGILRQQAGAVLHELGLFDEAVESLLRAAELLRVVHGTDRDPEIAAVQHELGEICIARGQYAEAQRFFGEVVSILMEVRGDPDHPEVATARIGLGEAQTMAGDYAGARQTLELALASLRRTHADRDHPALAAVNTALGRVQLMTGDARGARDSFGEALRIRRALCGDAPHPDVAGALHALGCALLSGGQLAEARSSLSESLAMWQAIYKDQPHHAVAGALFELARAERAAGELGSARARVEQALATWEIVFEGRLNPSVAAGLLELGGLQLASGDAAAARATLERSLEAWITLLGTDRHPYPAAALFELGRTLRALGDLEGARAALERCHALRLPIFGSRHPDLLSGLHLLARVLQQMERLDEAKARLDEADAIADSLFGQAPHGYRISLLDARGGLLLDLGDRAGARAAFAAIVPMARALYGPGSEQERVATEAVEAIDGMG